jgi:triosephosphate isomerase (TIM)
MRRTMIVGNWKMNGSFAANKALLNDIKAGYSGNLAHDVVICVPTPYLAQCAESLTETGIALGAQDISTHFAGAYTGEVSAEMLRDCGCQYVIVGHSERRAYHRESDDMVAQKALRALSVGITPIVCIGETLEERETGQTNAVVLRQLVAVLNDLDAVDFPRIVVAYEPVWAIGTGKTATSAMVQEVHGVLRAQLVERGGDYASQVRILYGGGMKPSNAKLLLSMQDVDGGLIGSASLRAADFLEIARSSE